MQQLGGQLILSPTDLTKHLACPHIATLDLAALDGGERAHAFDGQAPDDALELLFRLGLEHEAAYLRSLEAAGRDVVRIETGFDEPGRRAAEARTVQAMRSGADVVFQATFFDGHWGGQADFLLRVDRPSDLGSWSYDIADTKLARRLKVPALLQMATYAQRLAVLQGTEPEWLYVVTGHGESRGWRLVDVAAYARRARDRLRTAVELRRPTQPVPVAHCGQCRWSSQCCSIWQVQDDLSLVAGMRADHRLALRQAGITTVTQLAASAATLLPRQVGAGSRERLVSQASLQVSEQRNGTPAYELLAPVPRLGLLGLPEPSPGDLYLDFEGDPYAEDGAGREYLAGLGDRIGGFTALWAHDHAAEGRLVADLVDALIQAWRADPDMHVYHYASYETSALKRLTARHGVRERELDQLLRGERFCDLYAVVRQGVRISRGSYSIKALEAFYWGTGGRSGEVADGMASVVAYEGWLVAPDSQTLHQIEGYNRDDVRSTRALHDWLEERRSELESRDGRQPRPDDEPAKPAPATGEAELAELALAERLRAAGQPLLAALVAWHRREGRPRWWDVFRLRGLIDEDLVADATAVGGLSAPTFVREDKRSKLWRYTFAAQDTKVGVGDVLDVDTAKVCGTVFDLDAPAGWLLLRLGRGKDPPPARAICPPGPPNDAVLRESIARTAEALLVDQTSLGQRLLERSTPPGTPLLPGETPNDGVLRVGRSLVGAVLAVQGPPGSGKTRVAGELIRALLEDGKRVGVTASSHHVIGNLLARIGRPALQRCNEVTDFCGAPGIEQARDNNGVLAALSTGQCRLVGGTAWLWSREDMCESVDVLVVDEAGQFSLANAVAVAQSATSMVLLGDPQQLTQPTQAQHPDGADASALGHLLAGHDTIPADRGIFLGTSWRMHPAITGFVSRLAYDGRLASAPGRERQAVVSSGRLSGSGLRFVPVEHLGNTAGSAEEATVVAELVEELLHESWRDRHGNEWALDLADLLVVTPYNNHVGRLRAALPDGARVGTVDKFQGQQAPVVLYSMASSSARDAPRGVDFLFDVHRLNVALSRAKALAVVIASPLLLDAAVHSPEQLRKVNALCRLAEEAVWV